MGERNEEARPFLLLASSRSKYQRYTVYRTPVRVLRFLLFDLTPCTVCPPSTNSATHAIKPPAVTIPTVLMQAVVVYKKRTTRADARFGLLPLSLMRRNLSGKIAMKMGKSQARTCPARSAPTGEPDRLCRVAVEC